MARSSIWVHVQHAGESWSGRLIPGQSDQICVHFVPERGPVTLPLDTRVQIGIATPGMAAALKDEARLVQLDRRREDALECVFRLGHPDRLVEEVRGAVIHARPELRQWPRLAPRHGEVIVPVEVDGMPAASRRFAGRLIDSSAGGVGLAFPRVAEPLLCRSTTLRARVPRAAGIARWVCDVRYRLLLDEHEVRYGLQFVSDGVAVDPPEPELEALWDCPHCGMTGLLDDTHVHCPGCGRVSEAPRHHPSWRELATPEVHPLCGAEVACRRCGVVWSARASYCGHCGARLPVDVPAAALTP